MSRGRFSRLRTNNGDRGSSKVRQKTVRRNLGRPVGNALRARWNFSNRLIVYAAPRSRLIAFYVREKVAGLVNYRVNTMRHFHSCGCSARSHTWNPPRPTRVCNDRSSPRQIKREMIFTQRKLKAARSEIKRTACLLVTCRRTNKTRGCQIARFWQ